MRRKKKKCALILLIVGILSLISCGKKGKDYAAVDENGNYIVKIAYTASLCAAPVQIAAEKGYFTAEGLSYELVKVESTATVEAVGANQVDAGFGLVGKFITPLDNGLGLKFTSGIHTGCTKILVRKDSDIKTVADLKGKRIGVAGLADSPALTAKRALAKAGVGVSADNMQVEFIVYSNTDLPIALQNGAIDAFGANDPVASAAQQEYNLRAIVDTTTDEQFKDEYCCLSFVTTSFAEQHPDLAEKFTKAIIKASLWIEEHPYEAVKIQIANHYIDGDPEFYGAILDSYNYKPSVEGGLEALRNVAYELQDIGVLKAETDIEQLIQNSYLSYDFKELTQMEEKNKCNR